MQIHKLQGNLATLIRNVSSIFTWYVQTIIIAMTYIVSAKMNHILARRTRSTIARTSIIQHRIHKTRSKKRNKKKIRKTMASTNTDNTLRPAK